HPLYTDPNLSSHTTGLPIAASPPLSCSRVESPISPRVKPHASDSPIQSTPVASTNAPQQTPSVTLSMTPVPITEFESLFTIGADPGCCSSDISTLHGSGANISSAKILPAHLLLTSNSSPNPTNTQNNATPIDQPVNQKTDPDLTVQHETFRHPIQIIREHFDRPSSRASGRSSVPSDSDNRALQTSDETLSTTGTVVLICNPCTMYHLDSDTLNSRSESPTNVV
ncbi:hypothetical protein FGIG_00446, partial [Fasciola gigantica]